ncbi:hypothetical protein [Priestia flexa]|uniref:hypothetical protein n=1 Tax=Priestia flexa TaxID=86664 RepID=UPI00248FEEFF|nr:hypothetical protein [Priestia flexa]
MGRIVKENEVSAFSKVLHALSESTEVKIQDYITDKGIDLKAIIEDLHTKGCISQHEDAEIRSLLQTKTRAV